MAARQLNPLDRRRRLDRDETVASLRGLPSHGWTGGLFGRRDRAVLVLVAGTDIPYRRLSGLPAGSIVVEQGNARITGDESEVRRFFKQIDASVPRGLGVHVVLDNLSAHSTPAIKKWLAHRDRRRWHLHFTPTSSSWVNLIERWFKELTDKRLRRGVVTNVADLNAAITTWAQH